MLDCFRAGLATFSSTPNLTTSLYQTPLGIASLTWCRNLLGNSLFIIFTPTFCNGNNTHFRLYLNPLLFWKKQSSKLFLLDDACCKRKRRIEFYWDLTRAKFVSGPEPDAGFSVVIVVDGEIVLLVGDEAHSRTRTRKKQGKKQGNASLILRREHVFVNHSYTTKVKFGGKTYDVLIECNRIGRDDEPRLSFSIDLKRVLQVKRLKWRFRGRERIEVDGMPILVSWDVSNWLFDDPVDGHALFMFQFEKKKVVEEGEEAGVGGDFHLWQQYGVGMNVFERKRMKMKRSLSSSLLSLSSPASSSSSVMEWANSEESEMQRQSLTGFSLLVYAWKC